MHIIYKIMFFISMAMVLASLVIIAFFGLRLGADFRGGSVIELVFNEQRPSPIEINTAISSLAGVGDVSVSPIGDDGVTVRLNSIDEDTHQSVLSEIKQKFGDVREDRFDSIGPTVGSELKQKSITAIIVLLLSIVIYLAFVFRKMAKVLSPWAIGVAAILTLIHDITIPVGVFALLGHFKNIEIGAVFVAAALTILGFSVSDTVVVFDRVRENVLKFGIKEKFGELVHRSIMQTLSRSLNTTFTILLSLIAIFFFGGESIKYFSLALIIGMFLGAYSSIFVASPILTWWSAREPRK